MLFGYGENFTKVSEEYDGGLTNFLKVGYDIPSTKKLSISYSLTGRRRCRGFIWFCMPFIQNGSSRNVLSRVLDIAVDPLFDIHNGFFDDRLGNSRGYSQQYVTQKSLKPQLKKHLC